MKKKRRRKGKNFRRAQILVRFLLLLCGIWAVFLLLEKKTMNQKNAASIEKREENIDWRGAPEITVDLLTPNSYSRPQIPLEEIKGIVIHYTANPGSSAKQNRDYFESLSDGKGVKASSHFIVGLEGEVVQCIPTAEWAYASNSRNKDTISIECCHLDETGAFNPETYDSMVKLTGWLMHRFGLSSEDVIRHYDVTEKLCPLYFVEHEDAWEEFRWDAQAYCDSL